MRRLGTWLRRLLLFTCFAGATAAAVIAQSLSDVRPGERVQLSVRDSLRQEPILPARQLMVGQFVRATSDSVWLRSAGASEFSIARRNVRRASVSRGASRLRSALAFGAGLAFSFGVAVAIEQSDGGHDHRTRDAWTAAGVGLGAGIIVGALSPYEHWRPIRR